MFAILKDETGMPAALFEIERETPKRYYGRVVDQMTREKNWLSGLHEGHCEKRIVLALVRTENAWFLLKKDFAQYQPLHFRTPGECGWTPPEPVPEWLQLYLDSTDRYYGPKREVSTAYPC